MSNISEERESREKALLNSLAEGPKSFSDLLRLFVPKDMSHSTLSHTLATMETAGKIQRSVDEAKRPPKVLYSLQPRRIDKVDHIHDKIDVIYSRQRAVQVKVEMLKMSKEGDVFFGICRICTGFSSELFDEATKAVLRGVKTEMIMSDRPETEDLKAFFESLKAQNIERVQFKLHRGEVFSSFFGIRAKEVIHQYHFKDSFVAIHFSDPLATKSAEETFDSIWNSL